VVDQPSSTTQFYVVGQPELDVFSYNLSQLVTTTMPVSCGDAHVEFITHDLRQISVIFSEDRTVQTEWTISVFTEDLLLAGEYQLMFKFYYAQQPHIYVYSNIFVVIVVNPCIPPPNCITIIGCGLPTPVVNPPAINISIDVTVTVEVNYVLPSWNCGSPGCNTQIVPVCVDCSINGNVDVVIIVDNTININILACGNMCGSNPNGDVYIIVIQGCLGTVCADIDVSVTILNPCFNPDMYTIQPVPLPEIQFSLYTEVSVTHNSFDVVASVDLVNMCGGLTYTIDAGVLTQYIVYDVETHVIVIYCDDPAVVAGEINISYTIDVSITAYPNACGICVACCSSGGGVIVIGDPCADPFLPFIGMVPTVDFDFTAPASFTFPVQIVDPALHDLCLPGAVYQCTYLGDGPYTGFQNLCDFSITNGAYSSTGSFNGVTGTYTFNTND
jgi:hypothetical protein